MTSGFNLTPILRGFAYPRGSRYRVGEENVRSITYECSFKVSVLILFLGFPYGPKTAIPSHVSPPVGQRPYPSQLYFYGTCLICHLGQLELPTGLFAYANLRFLPVLCSCPPFSPPPPCFRSPPGLICVSLESVSLVSPFLNTSPLRQSLPCPFEYVAKDKTIPVPPKVLWSFLGYSKPEESAVLSD